jgi:alkanesulfonate monooxygenase
MRVGFDWVLPLAGDSRTFPGHFGRTPERSSSLSYLESIAAAASDFGLSGMLFPTGLYCLDPWVTASALSHVSGSLRMVIAVRPDSVHPLLVAHQVASFRRLHGRGVDLQLVAGGSPVEQAMFGDEVPHDERYQRLEMFAKFVRGALDRTPVDVDNAYFSALGAKLSLDPGTDDTRIFIGGSSHAAEVAASRVGDVFMSYFDGHPPHIERGGEGREPEIGVRLHVVSRSTDAEAERVVEAYAANLDDALVANERARQMQKDSEGQRRMMALNAGSKDNLWIAPHYWAGMGLARGGSGVALVGSYRAVADEIRRLAAMGVTHFMLSGYPNLEELFEFGEGVMPLMREAGVQF